jgi:hypothetical protein
MTGNTRDANRQMARQSVPVRGREWQTQEKGVQELKTKQMCVCELNILDGIIESLKKLDIMMVNNTKK